MDLVLNDLYLCFNANKIKYIDDGNNDGERDAHEFNTFELITDDETYSYDIYLIDVDERRKSIRYFFACEVQHGIIDCYLKITVDKKSNEILIMILSSNENSENDDEDVYIHRKDIDDNSEYDGTCEVRSDLFATP